MFNCKGKVAIITGGVKGIGLCIAKELLRNEVKGVVLLDTDFESGTATLDALANEFSKDRVIYINADVTQRSQFEDAFVQTIQTFNQLDIVVNNAGVMQEIQWEKCIAVNLQGCVTGSLLALDKYFPKYLGTSEGIILNVASLWGVFPCEYQPVYSATKHAIISFGRSISGPNRSRNLKVKVLTICPGLTMTPFLNQTPDQVPEEFIASAREMKKSCPPQTPEEVAQQTLSIINKGESGSVWAISGNTSSEIKFPDLLSLP